MRVIDHNPFGFSIWLAVSTNATDGVGAESLFSSQPGEVRSIVALVVEAGYGDNPSWAHSG